MILRFLRLFAAFRDLEARISLLTLELVKAGNERSALNLAEEGNKLSMARADIYGLKVTLAAEVEMRESYRSKCNALAEELGKAIIRQANPDCPACTRKGIRITELLSNNEAIKGAFRSEIDRATHAGILAEEKLATYKKAHPARKVKK